MQAIENLEIPPALRRLPATLGAWTRGLLRAIRDEGLDYRAASLAYTTLLSIVPGLALSFAFLKTFGVSTYLEPFLLQVLAPLGDKAGTLTESILGFVRKIDVGVLGFVGLGVLVYIIISMLEKIETAFNHIWRVDRARSFARRAGDYLSVALLGPVLIFSAIGLTASNPGAEAVRKVIGREPFEILFLLSGKVLPYLLVVAAFSFVYLYIPNTRVPWRAALFGGTVGGLLWKFAGLMFAKFIAGSASYHAIYSSLAIVILFMIWLDLSWLILLVGGQAALYFQHPHYLHGKRRFADMGSGERERLGLALMTQISGHFIRGEAPSTVDQLAERLALPWETVKDALAVLQAGRLAEETGRDNESYLPARDIATIPLAEIRRAMRGESGPPNWVMAGAGDPLRRVFEEWEQAVDQTPAAQISLRDFIAAEKT